MTRSHWGGIGGDQSFGTYFTNHFIALANLYCAYRLYQLNTATLTDRERLTKLLFILGSILEGISSFLAGIFHQKYVTTQSMEGERFWRIAMLLVVGSGGCRLIANSGIIQSTMLSSALRQLSLIGLVGLAVALNLRDLPFLLTGIAAGVLPQIVTIIISASYAFSVPSTAVKVPFKKALKTGLAGLAVLFGGAAAYGFGTDPCTNPCPIDCPFFPPNLNHNAAFHLFQILAVLLLGKARRSLMLGLSLRQQEETSPAGKKQS